MVSRLRFHRDGVAKRRAGTEQHHKQPEVLLLDLDVIRAEVICQERMRLTVGALPHMRFFAFWQETPVFYTLHNRSFPHVCEVVANKAF
jgi:hypothetical protein